MGSHRAGRAPRRRRTGSTETAPRPSRRGTVVGIVAALLVGLLLGGSQGSLAFWTDTDEVAAGSFTTGELQLNVDGARGPSHSAATTLTMVKMVPGESVAARLPITNTGDASFTWTAAVTTPTGQVAPHVTVSTSYNAVLTGQASTYPRQQRCDGGTPASGPAPLLLLGGATQHLCVQVSMPESAGNAAQNQTGLTFSVVITATQKLS